MYYCNTKVSLRTGGRKAPKGGVDKLKQLIPDLKSGESYELYRYLLENSADCIFCPKDIEIFKNYSTVSVAFLGLVKKAKILKESKDL